MIGRQEIDFSSHERHPEVATLIVPGAGISPIRREIGEDGSDITHLSNPSEVTIKAALTAAHFIADAHIEAAFFTGDSPRLNESARRYSTTEKEAMLSIVRMNLPQVKQQETDLRIDPLVSSTSFENMVNAGSFIEEFRDAGPIGIVGLKGHAARMRMMGRKLYGRRTEFAPVTIAHSHDTPREFVLRGIYRAAFIGADTQAMARRHEALQRIIFERAKRHSGEEQYS